MSGAKHPQAVAFSTTPPRASIIRLVPLLCLACTKVHSADTLELPDDPVAITIIQRSSESVPGSRGRIRLDIGDITAGQALTKLALEDAGDLVPRQSMAIGDTVEFSLDGRRLSLGLGRLVNYLVGDDHAIFYIGTPDIVVTAQIEDLLQRIETSKHVFVRLGADHGGKAMAEDLRHKWSMMAGEIHSAGDFIDRVAAGPTSTPCEVRIGGTALPLATWLRGR